MSLLARLATKPNLWARASEPLRWGDDDFPYEALSEISDSQLKNGLSVWALESRDDPRLGRIVAALAIHDGKDRLDLKTEVRFVSLAAVQQLGIAVDEKRGNLVDDEVNVLHRNLLAARGKQAVALLRAMALDEPGRPYTRKEVAGLIISSVTQGYVTSKQFPKTANLLFDCYKEGYVTFAM